MPARACPSCRAPLYGEDLACHEGLPLDIEICFACRGLWFDRGESQRLGAESVARLFTRLHEHRSDALTPLAQTLVCPSCRQALTRGFDIVKHGRYITFRCPQGHGRFSPFASFFIEKGFVRLLSPQEVGELAERVRVIRCTSCGAPVDIRKDHACPYCHSAFSLLDPKAVETALAHYAGQHRAAATPAGAKGSPEALADALIALERERSSAAREEASAASRRYGADAGDGMGELVGDLVAGGLGLLAGLLTRD